MGDKGLSLFLSVKVNPHTTIKAFYGNYGVLMNIKEPDNYFKNQKWEAGNLPEWISSTELRNRQKNTHHDCSQVYMTCMYLQCEGEQAKAEK